MKPHGKKKPITRTDVAPQKSFRDQGITARVHSANAELNSLSFTSDFRRVVVFMKYRDDDTEAMARHAEQMLKNRGQDMQGVKVIAKCGTSLDLIAVAYSEKESK